MAGAGQLSMGGATSLRRLVGRLLKKPPTDCRGGRLVAVIHCVLDQNVRDAGAAVFPAANWALLDLCREHGVGLLQMPCPELRCLGMARGRPEGCSLREALESPAGRAGCRQLAREVAEVAEVMAAHVASGRQVLAVLGGNEQSPGCAVLQAGNGLSATSGIFMQELAREVRERGLEIPFRGLRDADDESLNEDLAWVRARFGKIN